MENRFRSNYLYAVQDEFDLRYLLFKMINEDRTESCVIIGPYIERKEKIDAGEIVKKLNLEIYHIGILNDYYNGISIVEHIEAVVLILVEKLLKSESMQLEWVNVGIEPGKKQLRSQNSFENRLSPQSIEERYQCEEAVLNAVKKGDTEKAFLAMETCAKFRVEARNTDRLLEMRRNMVVLNVLLRKSVQQAGVHPYYINELSSYFGKKIESLYSVREILTIRRELIRKYCLLVKNHAFQGYSKLIANTINYIDLNIKENLTTKKLAEELHVNTNYLSSRFNKEVGQTITGYIHEKRISDSLILLTTTMLPIQEVAEKVGILDENYFSRLFKKIQGITPREYRMIMNQTETLK